MSVVALGRDKPQEQDSPAQSASFGRANARNTLSLHDHTYGITSDLTQFACVFAFIRR
jgi:hypothetical protein